MGIGDASVYYFRGLTYYHKGAYDKSYKDYHNAESLGYKVDPKRYEDLRKAGTAH